MKGHTGKIRTAVSALSRSLGREDVMDTRRIRILHAEDDERDADQLRERLIQAGVCCDLERAGSPEEFSDDLRHRRFDLIVSDCSMPAFDGLAVLRLSRELSPHTPFFFYSESAAGHESFETADRVVEKGDFGELLQMIRRLPVPPGEQAFPWKSMLESSACLEVFLKDNRDGILVFDQEGIVRFWNTAMSCIYGIDSEEAIGKSFVDLFGRVVRTGEELLLYHSFKGQSVLAKEGSHLHPLHRARFVTETSYWPLRGEQDALAGGIVLVRDVTREREAEATRRSLDTRFRRLFLRAPEVQLVTDFNGRISAANDKACRMLEFPRMELEGKHIACLFTGDGETTWRRIRDAVGQGGEIQLEEALTRRNGSRLIAEIIVGGVGNNEFLIEVRDRSDAVALQEKLRISEESFQSLAEMADDLILAISPTGIVNFLNAAFSRITGWSPSLWLGRDIVPLLHPDDLRLFEYTAQRVCSGNPGDTVRVRFRCTDGSYCVGECTSSPVMRRGEIAGTWHIIRLVPQSELTAGEVFMQMN